jgi:FHA domain
MVLGFGMILAGVVWGAVGYYVDQAFFLLALIGGGIVVARIGAKMADDPNPTKPVAWTPTEPTPPAVTQDVMDETPAVVAPLRADSPVHDEEPARVSAPAAVPVSGDVDEGTRMVTRDRDAATAWRLRLADGTEIPVRGAILLGRDPAPEDGQEVARLVSLADPDHSISKTHALVDLRGDHLVVRDLGSTNGTVVVSRDSVEVECAAGVDVDVGDGAGIELGTYVLRVAAPQGAS